jgi:hypothetical protein
MPPLTDEEIQRRSILISKLKEETINHTEGRELISILEKEKQKALTEEDNGRLAFAISSLISYVIEYLESQSEIISKEEE